MTRALAVAAVVGCACAHSSPDVAPPTGPACPASPALPRVDLSLCPVERPSPPLVVTEPPDDSVLVRGNGFWCTDFMTGKWAGEGSCFRFMEACEEWRRLYGKPGKTTACRRAERASCMKILDYKRMGLFYRCVPPDKCEARRAAMISRRPDLGVGECREMN